MGLFTKNAGKYKSKGQTALSSYETKTKTEEQNESTKLSGKYNTKSGFKTLKSMAVPTKKTKNDNDISPFGIDILDKKFQQTAMDLYETGKKYGSARNPLEDAYNLTLSFAQTAMKSYGLIGSKDKNPLVVADKSFDQLLQETKWDYQYSNLSHDQYQQALQGLQYQPESAIKAQNEQNVLNLAKQRGLTGLTKEEEEQARMYEEAARYGGNAGKLINGSTGVGMVPLTPEGENEINPYRMDAKTRKKYAQQAEALRQKGQITYEDADAFLQNDSAYSFARDHAGDLTGYAAGFASIGDIVKKAQEQGAKSLTQQEYEIYESAIPEINRIAGGKTNEELTDADLANISAWGSQYADQLRGMNGVFSAYQPTEEQQFVLGLYRDTLEGAQEYLEEATGTAEEKKAQDNYWIVSRRTKAQENAARPDFDATTQPKEEYMSDPLYAAVAGKMTDNLLTSFAVPFEHSAYDLAFLSPDEKGQFFWTWENLGKEEARDYLDLLQYTDLGQRRERFEDLGTKSMMSKNAGNAAAYQIWSLLENQVAGLVGTADLYGQMAGRALGLSDKPIDTHSKGQALTHSVETIRQTTDEMLADELEQWGVPRETTYFLNDTLMSFGDSMVGGAIAKGISGLLGIFDGMDTVEKTKKTAEWITGMFTGSRAANEAVVDVLKRDGNEGQAAISGALAWLFEGLGEKVEMKLFFDDFDKLGKKKWIEKVKILLNEMFVNATQEGITTTANILADVAVMGKKSKPELLKTEYEQLGASEEEQNSLVAAALGTEIGMSSLGGGLIGIPSAGVAIAGSSYQTSKVDNATGAVVMPDTQNILKTFGEQLGGDAAEVAKEYDPKKATNKQTGELVRTIFGQLTGEYRDTLLDRVAVDLHDAGAGLVAGRSIAKMMAGQELTPEEIQTLAKDQQAMQVMYEVFGGGEQQQERGKKNLPNLHKDQAVAFDGEALANVGPLPGYGTDENEQREKQGLPPLNKGITEEALDGVYVLPAETEKQEKQPKEGLPTLNKGITAEALDGVAVPEKEEAAQEKQGKQGLPTLNKEAKPMALFENETAQQTQTDEGQEQEQKELPPHGRVLEVAFDGDSGVVEARMEDGSTVPLSESGLSEDQQALAQEVADLPQDAQAAVTKLWEPGQNIKNLVNGFKRIFNAAAQGRNGASLYGEQLTQEQRQAAMEAGKAEFERTKEEMAAKTKETLANLKKRGFHFKDLNDDASKAGGVYFARVLNRVTDAAAAQLSVIQKLAEKYGMQVRVYDTMDENGSYETGSNVINLALDAEGGMLGRTVSHELFHFVREWSQEAGDKLRTYVLNALKNAQGYDYEARKRQIMDQYKNETGKALTPEEAEEEMAAEGMLDALDTEEALHDLFTETKDKTMIEKIKNWLSDMAKSIRAAIDSLAWNHPEVRALKDQADYLQGVSDRLKTALEQAAENYRASQRGLYADAAADPDVQAYTEAIKEKGITQEDVRDEADYLANKLYLRAEKNWIEQHQDMYEAGFEKAKAAMMEYAQGKTSMVKAFTDQGLFAPPQELFPALAYAGRQMAAFQGGVQFSRRATAQDTAYQNESFEYMKAFDEQVDDFMSEDREALLGRNSLLVSKAPEVFIEIGLPNLPVTIDQKHTGYALKGNYPDPKYRPGHTFTREEFKKLPQKIADPIAIGYDPQTTKQVIVYVDMKNTTGQQVIVPLRIGGVANIGNNRIQALKLLTSFADEDGLNMLKSAIQNDSNDHNTIFYLNKEKAAEVGTGDGMKTTVHFPSSGLIHKITDSGSPVKLEIQTQTDSKQFKQWFGNSQVKNEDKTPKVMYHGTASDFWAFDLKKSNDKTGRLLGLGAGANKIYLTENEASAEMAARGAAARTKNGKERVLGLYVSAQKVMDREEYNRRLQEAYAKYPNSDPRGEIYDYKQRDKAIKAVDKQVKAEGYDGVWDKESGEMFVYDPTQVKSATENIGTFDRKNPDIRFSQRANTDDRQDRQALEEVADDPELYNQMATNADTMAAWQMLMRLHKLTTAGGDNALIQKGAFEKRLSEIVKSIEEKTGTKYGPIKLRNALRNIYQAMEQSQYSPGEILQYTRDIMRQVLDASPGVLVEQDETTKEIISELKNRKFYLTDDQKSEIKNAYGTISRFAQKNFGTLRIVKRDAKTASLEDVWREDLAPRLPGVFAEDTSPLDMPGILDAWLETAKEKKYAGEFGRNIGAYATDLALNAMLDFYDVPGALKSEQQIREAYEKKYLEQEESIRWIRQMAKEGNDLTKRKAQERIDAVNEREKARVDKLYEQYAEDRKKVAEIRGKARDYAQKVKKEYQDKYRERIEKSRERRQETEAKTKLINQIKKDVSWVKTRVIKPTDNRHIPEEYRGAAERFVAFFLYDRAVFPEHDALYIKDTLEKMMQDDRLHSIGGLDKETIDRLSWLQANVAAGTHLRDMTIQQLEQIQKVVGNLRVVFTQDSINLANREWKLETFINRARAELNAHKDADTSSAAAAARKWFYKETTPIYYSKRIGGVIGDAIRGLISKQRPYAFKTAATKEYLEGTKEKEGVLDKYNVRDWIYDKERLKFRTAAGDEVELTRNQALTLRAWWKREMTNNLQDAAHLRMGGFTYDTADKDTRKLRGINLHKAHMLRAADMAKIENWLTDEQKAFGDEMVNYLSTTAADWGNEASMRMFGYNKYEERYYFPYTTDSQYRGKGFDQEGQGSRELVNMSSSHALTEKARNPLKLANFTDLWAAHVDQMAMYSAFAEDLYNIKRITNYVEAAHKEDEEGERLGLPFGQSGETELSVYEKKNGKRELNTEGYTPYYSIKKEMERAYGREAVQYLETLLADLNGGMRGDERGTGAKMFSLFKKGSVAANLSVMLQQPSAFVRAMSMVHPKFFVKGLSPKDLKGVKARMYQNSGAAIIKQMGRFDTNIGKSSKEWLMEGLGEETKLGALYAGMDKWTGKGAELADELTWCYMYSAIENEVEANTDLERGTEAFNEAVGKRFDEVMTQTQVYDSTLAKSEWMRSTGGLDKMFTSFMAEPTLWANMLMDAAMDVMEKKPGAGKNAAIAAGIFIGGSFVNAVLKSLATALRRKDDEGRTWLEKYLAEVTGNFIEDVSPFGIASMVPIARDVVSLVQGFDVERADMTLVSELLNKVGKLVKKGEKATGEEWIDAGAAAANIFGIPFRNMYRDLKGLLGAFFGGANASGPSEGRDIWLSILDEVGDNLRIWSITPYDSANKAYYDRMEQALLAGDMDRYNWLRGYMTDTNQVTEKSVDTGVKNEIKDSFTRGLISDDKAMKILQDQFGMDKEKAWSTTEEWRQKAEHADDEDYRYTEYGEVLDLVKEGKDVTAAAKKLTDNAGVTDKDVRGKIKSEIGKWYKNGEITRGQTESKLKQYAKITDANDLYWIMDEWDYLKANPKGKYGKYNKYYAAIEKGDGLTAETKRYMDHGVEKDTLSKQITSQYKPQYVALVKAGKTTQAAELKARILRAYEVLGYDRNKKIKDIDKWLKDQ